MNHNPPWPFDFASEIEIFQLPLDVLPLPALGRALPTPAISSRFLDSVAAIPDYLLNKNESFFF